MFVNHSDALGGVLLCSENLIGACKCNLIILLAQKLLMHGFKKSMHHLRILTRAFAVSAPLVL